MTDVLVWGTKTVPSMGQPEVIEPIPSTPTPGTPIPSRPSFEELIKARLNDTIDISGRKVPTWLIGTGGLLGVAALAAIASAASEK